MITTKTSKLALIFKKALFPSIMTILSFVLFIGAYFLVTVRSIEPYYFKGLLFAVPFICFGIITFFTVTEKLKVGVSSVITGILISVLGLASLFAFVYIAFDAATTITTDTDKYERILSLTGYPNNDLIKYFPNKIPGNAKDTVFSYNPAFMQGGENFDLKYKVDSGSIKNYINEFSKKAKWVGKSIDSEAEKNGIFLGTFTVFDDADLPYDFTIYLIVSKPYHTDDWNHGEISLVAISEQRNEILFHAEDW